jgi:hypothetical protein
MITVSFSLRTLRALRKVLRIVNDPTCHILNTADQNRMYDLLTLLNDLLEDYPE